MSHPNKPSTRDQISDLMEAFLGGRSVHTAAAYRVDLRAFADFTGKDSPAAAVATFLTSGRTDANLTALRWRAALVKQGLAPASVNRRLAALRSVTDMANTVGLVHFTLEVRNVRAQPYRDTAGPGLEGFKKLVAAASARPDAKGARDTAILRLLFDLGLRRSEVLGLTLADLDMGGAKVSVVGKGRREPVHLSLPEATHAALECWLEFRGAEDGPLFTSMSNQNRGQGLTSMALWQIVTGWGRTVGIKVTPHGLRHSAITLALDMTGGDIRAVAKFSRHVNLQTLIIYDDNRSDLAGMVANLIAGETKP